jgi:hypothetical protein
MIIPSEVSGQLLFMALTLTWEAVLTTVHKHDMFG